MQVPPTGNHYLPSLSRGSRLLRVLVIGPELLAMALHALLSTFDDISALPPISEVDQVLPFIRHIGNTEHSVDVVIIYWSGDQDSDHTLLQSLCAAGLRCLIVMSFYFPDEVEFIKKAGGWGLLFSASSSGHFATALRTIARGQKYFTEICSPSPKPKIVSKASPRLVVFHEERLKEFAQEILWGLNKTEIEIFRSFITPRVDDIADRVHLRPATVRRELSEQVYEFLQLISGRAVPNRFVAFQVLEQYGIIEYVTVGNPRHSPGF